MQTGKAKRKGGFTLAELLIVVAIIAVLTAIAIPIFTKELERSRQSADLANLRNTYAEAAAEAIVSGGHGGSAVSGIMQHTGLFDKLGEATIGDLDLTTNGSYKAAGAVVKGRAVRLLVSDQGNVTLEYFTDGTGLEGTTATAAQLSNPEVISDFLNFAGVDGNLLKRSYTTSQGVAGQTTTMRDPIVGQYGQESVTYYWFRYKTYFKWDGANWYQASGEGQPWIKLH